VTILPIRTYDDPILRRKASRVKRVDASLEKLVADGYIPKNLSTVVVREEDLSTGIQIFELGTDADALWQDAFQRLQAGV